VFDASAFGGQAGASARIENYLGFPTGISGQALTGRAFVQAQKFGAEMAIPVEVTGLECGVSPFSLTLANGMSVKSLARRFGEVRRFKAGDLLFVTGERSPGMFVLIAGTVAVSSRDCLGHVVPIVER
jgi:thioredoxin reductase (NADPH)